MRILIITDAWLPQVNGVVTSLRETIKCLEKEFDDTIYIMHPGLFYTVPSTYPDVRFAVNIWNVGNLIREFNPDAIHIATEGPVGWAGRIYCHQQNLKYTTSYHTQFPEYIEKFSRGFISSKLIYPGMRWMHSRSINVLVTTESMKQLLKEKGFKNLTVWPRGVDTKLFNPTKGQLSKRLPVALYVGRVSIEKNIEAFLELDLPGMRKVVVGDGPIKVMLQKKYPEVIFKGPLFGESLAEQYASADVFVFPSRTDTFGVVMLEANACGTPIAAYPVQGPKDVVINGHNGYLSENLKHSIERAMFVSRNGCRSFALSNTWTKATETFRNSLIYAI